MDILVIWSIPGFLKLNSKLLTLHRNRITRRESSYRGQALLPLKSLNKSVPNWMLKLATYPDQNLLQSCATQNKNPWRKKLEFIKCNVRIVRQNTLEKLEETTWHVSKNMNKILEGLGLYRKSLYTWRRTIMNLTLHCIAYFSLSIEIISENSRNPFTLEAFKTKWIHKMAFKSPQSGPQH